MGRQLQVDVVGSFPAPKAALMDNPGSAPRTVVLSFKTLQIVHVTEDINVARDSNGGGGSETSSGIPRLVGTVTEAPTPGPRSVKRTRAAAQAAAPPPAPSTSEGTTDPAAAVRIAHLEARVASLEWCVSTMRDTIATLADGVLDKNALRARVGGAAGHMPPMHGDAMQGFPGQQGALPSPFNLPPSVGGLPYPADAVDAMSVCVSFSVLEQCTQFANPNLDMAAEHWGMHLALTSPHANRQPLPPARSTPTCRGRPCRPRPA